LTPGSTSANQLQVGLNTSTAGNFTGANAGSATVALVSDANNVGNCAPNCQLTLTSQIVNVLGKVYSQATGALNTALVDFGVLRVGDVVATRNINVSNTAATSALSDTLKASLAAGVPAQFTGSGMVAGVAAQANGNIAVGVNTSTAGLYTHAGSVVFLSQNPDMADVSAGANGAVQLKAQVNNLANADFDLLSGLGTLTQVGDNYVLDLGSIALGSSVLSRLHLDNDVAALADDLSGNFDLSAADDFAYAGWGAAVNNLAAGQATGNLDISFVATSLGALQDSLVFNGRGTNASDLAGLAQTRRLTILANVVDPTGTVPEPGSLALVLLAGGGLLWVRRGKVQSGR
jgi:hypothetical protein